MPAILLIAVFLLMPLQAVAGPKLFVLDCGSIKMDSLEMFGLEEGESDVSEMFVPCYLVRHDKGLLLWDGGLPRSVADADEPVFLDGGSMVYDTWIEDQLEAMGLTSADVTHAAYSHLHFDHAGAANYFLDSEVLMQRTEWDAAFAEDAEYVDTSLFDGLKRAKLSLLDGDHDVFGDGSVRLIYAPGHTPGHPVLLVTLDNAGPILLSGDLYHTRANRKLQRPPIFNSDAQQTLASMQKIEQLLVESGATLWIEHDKALADTLKKAPAFYD